MGEVGREVVELGEGDVGEVVGLLCESFFDYPAMRFVLRPDPRHYQNQLQTLIHFFVMARVLRKEVLLGIGDDKGLAAAARCRFPPESSPLSSSTTSAAEGRCAASLERHRAIRVRNSGATSPGRASSAIGSALITWGTNKRKSW